MRDYKHIDRYLNSLLGDVYPQPPDDPNSGHNEWFREVLNTWISKLQGISTVLDVGCGQGQFQDGFTELGLVYTGVALGEDVIIAKQNGKNVEKADFNFLPYDDNSFDLVFSRHTLEHSPFPLLSLMEWRRVSKQFLCVILPNPKHFTYRGKNHYSVMPTEQFIWLCNRAGWSVIWEHTTDFELRFMMEKIQEVKE